MGTTDELAALLTMSPIERESGGVFDRWVDDVVREMEGLALESTTAEDVVSWVRVVLSERRGLASSFPRVGAV